MAIEVQSWFPDKKIMKQREKWTVCMKSFFLLAGILLFDEKSAKVLRKPSSQPFQQT
jgi:hypothetical protein